MEEGPINENLSKKGKFTLGKENLKRGVEMFTQDPVGGLFIATAIVAANLDFYPLAISAFGGGIYHITEIDKLQRRKQGLLERAKSEPRLLQKLDDIHSRLESGDLSDKYTAWL
jgi:hypothetical protein